MSDLSRETGIPVATLKYYLREGLLHAGETTSRTRASYDDSHVARVRLVRALHEVGGLPLASVAKVLEAIDAPPDRLGLLATAQRALVGEAPASSLDGRAQAWLTRRGWLVEPGDPAVVALERAWDACDAADIGVDEERLDAYADAVEQVAEIDVASVPGEPVAAVRQVVLGTVLVDPLLAALRRLAHQHVSVRTELG